jgi:hypothetical protein
MSRGKRQWPMPYAGYIKLTVDEKLVKADVEKAAMMAPAVTRQPTAALRGS